MMKINSNIPIFVILTIFIASNALLYTYLNDGYFIDKKPETPEIKVENVIFRLISAHEDVLNKRNAEILLEAERLRNRKLTVTDDAELRAIEEKLRALELESENVLEQVRNSENEKRAAERKARSNQLQLTELMEINSKMGAQLESVTEEFDNYVETLKNTLESNSFSEKDLRTISIAFRNRRGLYYLENLVGNIQKNRAALSRSYTEQLSKQSAEYHQGLKTIASHLGNSNYTAIIDSSGMVKTEDSIKKLITSINRYIALKDKNNKTLLSSELKRQESKMLQELSDQLSAIQKEGEEKLKTALEEQLLEQKELRLSELESAAKDKALSLTKLEARLREELKDLTTTVEVKHALPDKLQYTSWIHIPGLWESSTSDLSFSGKKVNTIAWSRNKITDNQVITFKGDFKDNGECIIILYGNGRFKNWDDGVILTISSLSSKRLLIDITTNGVGDNAEKLFSNSFSTEDGINGEYNIQILRGKLSISLNRGDLITNYSLDTPLSGRLGFANRVSNSHQFNISNIQLFNIR